MVCPLMMQLTKIWYQKIQIWKQTNTLLKLLMIELKIGENTNLEVIKILLQELVAELKKNLKKDKKLLKSQVKLKINNYIV